MVRCTARGYKRFFSKFTFTLKQEIPENITVTKRPLRTLKVEKISTPQYFKGLINHYPLK